MILRTLEIVGSSFLMAIQELWKNKLRTFLSLLGVTFGIFCIISVLATVNSLEQNIQNEVKSLGTNTIYVDKWDYSGGPNYPWWKFVKRPSPKYEEAVGIKPRTPSAKFVAFKISAQDKVDYQGNQLSNIQLYGVSEEFSEIQPVEIAYGRYLSESEFQTGSPVAVVGNKVAEELYGVPEGAIGKLIQTRGKKFTIVGVIKKQGSTFIGGWQFDQSLVTSYRMGRNIMDGRRADPLILVQGQDYVSSKQLKDDLMSTMRALHKLSPTQEDDFSLNDINDFSSAISDIFVNLNLGGWAIAVLSLIVGMFGVANIMFVSVRERTSQIGLKKAIGAKGRVILSEFLLEAAFLCVIGGLIGLTLVFALTQVLTQVLNFPVFISLSNMLLAILLCIVVGILAGYIPARQAARLDPVVAIRSK
ncbi:MAG: FtsX-like permease family protein [Bacteroidetes bacterium]|nr:FtsX-like permease family protein [Bacteroidota bacterium]